MKIVRIYSFTDLRFVNTDAIWFLKSSESRRRTVKIPKVTFTKVQKSLLAPLWFYFPI